ncbi:amidohydrolase [Microbacterium sp. ASV49]|uniref:Amidohydrolase n=1 Tax=Microbacterium candidum TaxID=3041922 RepID=A0ABT7MV56_9MICO|nr:amidohydrolase [Microbacterium sp. ASV49]MDL9978341.1 amidohydrolase [Microbacterium sp. ASV49]
MLDGRGGKAGAMLVVDGVISAIGAADVITDAAPTGAAVVDLPGEAVIAGFHDAHIHTASLARSLDALDLRDAPTLAAALTQIEQHLAQHPGDGWLTGGRWDANRWSDGVPTRAALDRLAPHRPVSLPSVDGHSVWVNGEALRRAGIDASTPDPVGGRIERDVDGEPTGLLRETAADAVIERAERETPVDLVALLERAHGRLLSEGITHVTDLDGEDARAAYLRLKADGRLRLRVHKGTPADALEAAVAEGRRTGAGDDWFTNGPVKLFSDGALGSHTAHMGFDFAGEPGNHGVEVLDLDELVRLVDLAVGGGIAVATHAIGDRANRTVLDAYEHAHDAAVRAGLRLRMEHAQHLEPADVARFARLGVIASQQPTHWASDIPLVESMLHGRDLASYAWAALRDAGAVVAFGSDAPVEPSAPLLGVRAAAVRGTDASPLGAERGIRPLSVEEALSAYTAGPADAAGLGHRVGRLASGQLADFVVLDRDPLSVEPSELGELAPVATVVGGTPAFGLD